MIVGIIAIAAIIIMAAILSVWLMGGFDNTVESLEKRKERKEKICKIMKNKKSKYIISAAVVAVVLLSGITVIPTGSVGVRSRFGQISEKVVTPGIKYHIPIAEGISKVNTKMQDAYFEGKVWSETSDMTEIYYDQITVTYQIAPDKAAWIVSNVANYKDALVSKTAVNSAVKEASRQLASKDATNRGKIEPLVQKSLQESLNKKYNGEVVTIARVVIGDANFEESYNQAIAARQKSQIEAEQQAIENQKAIDKAKADAEVAKTQAQGQADAEKIKAEGEAEANKKLAQSLNDKVLENKKLEKWDGKLPTYEGNGNSSIVLKGE